MRDSTSSLLIGRGTIAVQCLNILLQKERLPKIIICDTQDSGEDSWTKSLYKRAIELGYHENVNLFKETKVNRPEFINKIQSTGIEIDIIFSIQPYAIFRMPFINLANKYVVNLHMAPLPKLRGVSPIPWAFIDDLDEMGVTLHLIQDPGVDNGPIVFQVKFPIKEEDTAWTLYQACINNGTKLFEKNVLKILEGNINPMPQKEDEVTYHPMGEMDFADLEIPIDKDCKTAFNFIRARIFPVFQLPYMWYEGKKIFIKSVQRKKISTYTKITYVDGRYYLPCADGMLILGPQE